MVIHPHKDIHVYTIHVASRLLKNGRPRLITLEIFMYRHTAPRRPPSRNTLRSLPLFFSVRVKELNADPSTCHRKRARAIEEISITNTHLSAAPVRTLHGFDDRVGLAFRVRQRDFRRGSSLSLHDVQTLNFFRLVRPLFALQRPLSYTRERRALVPRYM